VALPRLRAAKFEIDPVSTAEDTRSS